MECKIPDIWLAYSYHLNKIFSFDLLSSILTPIATTIFLEFYINRHILYTNVTDTQTNCYINVLETFFLMFL